MNRMYILLLLTSLVLASYTSYSQTVVTGKASFYADRFHGRKTANGEKYLNNLLTAAHPNLPFGTLVKVTNLNNGKSVIVKVNDRGPFSKARIIDLSKEAARQLGFLKYGIADVQLEYQTPITLLQLRPDTVKHIQKRGLL